MWEGEEGDPSNGASELGKSHSPALVERGDTAGWVE